jgi:predicted transcriptional regulator
MDATVHVLAEAIEEHTAARGVDLWAVETQQISVQEWAEMTGRDPSTIHRNIRRARDD